ncbi:hypothetical protein CEXT_788511 [Caerostris extrusa]|uniref:Uncharacterized protein n=1 Tax=Caerostris extrusa TaxID=172846 RepID=A0AAV4N6N8_CAEEX|nr:hypothetical protein CEXT_788511 [Caerostris extrusa]
MPLSIVITIASFLMSIRKRIENLSGLFQSMSSPNSRDRSTLLKSPQTFATSGSTENKSEKKAPNSPLSLICGDLSLSRARSSA